MDAKIVLTKCLHMCPGKMAYCQQNDLALFSICLSLEFLSHSNKFELVYHYAVTGEGNGNPLQYSCLENPMDGGAW